MWKYWYQKIVVLILIPLFILSLDSAFAQSQISLPPSVSLTLVKSGFVLPVQVTHAGDGSGRLFVVEQDGSVRILINGNLLNTPFLDISARVRSPGEEGLLSIAFPPGFGAGKEYFYVYYTNNDGDNQVSRFHLSANPNVAEPSSEQLILEIPHPVYSNHNGGQLFFGPDGYLYIGTGDGGGGGDPDENAQDLSSLLGKLLRIDVEPDAPSSTDLPNKVFLPLIFSSGSTATYSIPPDNPFLNHPGSRPEIWGLGLRNPWRFSFDRTTGDLYIGDVGQAKWEEIDFQPASSSGGENYGWDNMEGLACYEPTSGCLTAGMTLPVNVYGHDLGCSVTGGYVYRGAAYPSLQGIYLFADYCSGRIWGLEPGTWVRTELADTTYNISSFGEDESGELYLTTLGGAVYRVVTP